jgi:hypothetical protein
MKHFVYILALLTLTSLRAESVKTMPDSFIGRYKINTIATDNGLIGCRIQDFTIEITDTKISWITNGKTAQVYLDSIEKKPESLEIKSGLDLLTVRLEKGNRIAVHSRMDKKTIYGEKTTEPGGTQK